MTNVQNLNNTAKAAASSVKNVSIMYAINEANKLARKNEFIDNTDVAAFGRLVKSWAKDNNLPEYNGLFSAYMFTNINGVSCYKKVVHKKASDAYAVDVDVITWCPVLKANSSISPVIQLINACKAVMKADAKAADKTAREKAAAERKAARKAESSDKKAARRTLKAEQKAAREKYAAGEICIAEFAEIMAKAI